MKKIVPKVFLLFALSVGLLSCTDRTEASLRDFDALLARKDIYEQNLLDRVGVLEEVLSGTDDPVRAYDVRKLIAREFAPYSMDSTIFYFQANREFATQTGDLHRLYETYIMMADEYVRGGDYLEAKGLLDKIEPADLPQDLLQSYYTVRHFLAGQPLQHTTDQYFRQALDAAAEYYRNLLLSMVREGSVDWHWFKMEEADHAGDRAGAFEHAKAIVEKSEVNSQNYAIGCYYCYQYSTGGRDEKIDWLIKSATSDLICGRNDHAALYSLGMTLFEEGDIDRSFKYLAYYCLPDAIFFGGTLRTWQLSRIFPSVQAAYQDRAVRERRVMTVMIIVLLIMVVIICLLLVLMFRRQKILQDTRQKLSLSYAELEENHNSLVAANQKALSLNRSLEEANQVKESFIALFLGILSDSINSTRQYKNHVLHLIRKGAVSTVKEEIELMPPIDEDIEEFYKMFDRTFIELYPDFVGKFNALLRDGEAVMPKDEDRLTPELRIFALIRMGITDSGKIADLLHYSVNTIYNYRAKMKNKAKGDRNEFEEAVKAL